MVVVVILFIEGSSVSATLFYLLVLLLTLIHGYSIRWSGMYGTKEEFHVKTLPNRKHVHTFRGAHPQARQWYKSIVYIPICYYRPYNSGERGREWVGGGRYFED